MLCSVVAIEGGMMKLVEDVTYTGNLESIMTEPCSNSAVNYTSQGDGNVHCQGGNYKRSGII